MKDSNSQGIKTGERRRQSSMNRATLAISSSFLRDLASKPSRLDDQVIFVTQPFPRDCRLIKVQVSSISAKLLCFCCGLILKRVKQVLSINPTAGEAAQFCGAERGVFQG